MVFDESKYLVDVESQRFLLNDAIGSGDPRYIAYALRAVARARLHNSEPARLSGRNRAIHPDSEPPSTNLAQDSQDEPLDLPTRSVRTEDKLKPRRNL